MDTDAFLNYLAVEKRYSVHTLDAYRRDLLRFSDFLATVFQISDLKEAQTIHVRSYVASLYQEGLKPRSIHRNISSVQSFYRFLTRKFGFAHNPCRKVIKPKAEKKLPSFITEDEIQKVEKPVSKDIYTALRDHTIVSLLYCTGIRLSELVSLKLSDLDLGGGTMRVFGKRSKERILPLLPELIYDLQCYLEKRKEISQGAQELFLTNKGKPIYQRLVQRITKDLMREEGVSGKTNPHIFRHTFATHLLNGGADMNAVKELLGHSSLAATQVYTHNTIDKLKKIHEQAHPRAQKQGGTTNEY